MRRRFWGGLGGLILGIPVGLLFCLFLAPSIPLLPLSGLFGTLALWIAPTMAALALLGGAFPAAMRFIYSILGYVGVPEVGLK